MEVSTTPQINKKVLHTWNWGDSVFVRYDDHTVEEVTNRWYFCIDSVNSIKALSIMSTIQTTCSTQSIGNFIRVYVADREARPVVVLLLEKNGVPTYEGDLLPDKRWYIDREIVIGESFKKLYIDIETDDSSKMIEVGKDMIVSFAAVDDTGKKYFEYVQDGNEEKLLKKFLKIIKNYDILLTWNGSGFDIPYLKERMRKYNLHKTKDYCWKEVAHFDLLKRFRHIFRFDSHIKTFALDFVAKHFIGHGKIEHTEKIIELWKNNIDKLREYNIEDCLLVKELDEKLGVSNMMIRQCQWCGVPPAQFGLYSIIDSYILKKAHSIGKYCQTSVKAIEERDKTHERVRENPNDTTTDKAKYTGAAVLDPKIGKYDNVYTFDFKGLYPSMMRTSNIGYDSLRYVASDNRITNPGTLGLPRKAGPVKPTYFEKEKSVINLAITDLIMKRGVYKDLKLKMIEEGTNKGQEWEKVVSDEIIVKELANSTYGIMGLEYGRYYSVDVAESITLFGQWCLNFAKTFFESQGFEVIYGDTDSVFVNTKDKKIDVDYYLKGFHDALRSTLKNYNIEEVFIQLNFDKEYDSFLLIAKKTYVGHVINIEGKKTNDVYARGMEFHKKNTFSYAAKKQKELIDYILANNRSKKELKDWLQQCKKDYDNKIFEKEELVITQKVGKSVEEYSKTPPLHVRLAQQVMEDTGVDLYKTEVDYIITNSSKGMNGIMAEKYNGTFDKEYYWSNKTQPVLERVALVLYPDIDAFNRNLSLFDI